MTEIPTAAGKLEEIVAMSCLPEADSEPNSSWALWLDLWAQAVRHPEVASVRQKFDERWRDLICSLVVAGQEAGEFGPVDPVDFAVLFSALLPDGLAVTDRAGRSGRGCVPCIRAGHDVCRHPARVHLESTRRGTGIAGTSSTGGGPVAGGHIELVALTKRFTEVAVDSVDLTVASGEFVSLLGPSGCGKTTTLRLIAGFEQPTAGKVLLDGADMTGIPPHRRNVNTVFQSYALFPFISVFDNVAYGLRRRPCPRANPPSGSTGRWTWCG